MLKFKNKSTAPLALFLALLLINACIFGFLGAYLRLDISRGGLYTLSDPTKKLLKNLDMEITLNVLDAEHADKALKFLYDSYGKYSKNIKVNYTSASEFSEYLEKEIGVSTADAGAGSLIISSRHRDVFVYSGWYYNIYFNEQYYEYSQFEQILIQASQYYASNPDYLAQFFENVRTEAFDAFRAEEFVSTHIEHVTREIIPHAYLITDHGGDALLNGLFGKNALLNGLFGKNALLPGMEFFSLSENGAVPHDANTLIISAPDEDLTDGETEIIREFLAAGGALTVFTTEKNHSQKNLMSILEYYGMTVREGGFAGMEVKSEEDGEPEKTNEISVNLNIDNDIFGNIDTSKNSFKIKDANALILSGNKRDTLLVGPIFTTDKEAYIGDDKDTVGTHTVAAFAEEVINGKGITRVVWYTGVETYTSEKADTNMAGVSAVTLLWMSNTFKSTVGSVKPVLLEKTDLNISNADVIIISVLLIGVAPLSVLFIGYSVTQKRKNA